MNRRFPSLLISSLILMLGVLGIAACRRGGEAPGPAQAGPVRRIVSLTPSLTEIVFAVGAGDRLVGVSDYCDYPPEAQARPRVGSFLSPSLERILALQPDLVLLDGVQQEMTATLQEAGLFAMPVPMDNLAEVRKGILAVGQRLGAEGAARQIVAGIDRDLAAVAPPPGARRPRVLFVVDRDVGGLQGLVVAGPGTYLDELIHAAGGDNIFSDLPLRYAKVSTESISARRPEVVLDAVHVSDRTQDSKVLLDWQALPEVPAVASGRVFLLSQKEFITPGPRLGTAVRELSRLLRGGLISQR